MRIPPTGDAWLAEGAALSVRVGALDSERADASSAVTEPESLRAAPLDDPPLGVHAITNAASRLTAQLTRVGSRFTIHGSRFTVHGSRFAIGHGASRTHTRYWPVGAGGALDDTGAPLTFR
jgi:hypothetical protein